MVFPSPIAFNDIDLNVLFNSRVFVWGYNGYCRLGLGNQVDALVPKQVPQFAGPNEITMGAYVVAGPSNSVVIDKQGMYWMAGKWKNTGDGTTSLPCALACRVPRVDASHGLGSGGQPFSTFKFIQDIMYVTIPHTVPRLNGR